MANLVRGRGWGSVKPTLGSQIDWSHPLTDGLRNLFVLNEAGGLVAVDVAASHARIVASASGPSWQPGGGGSLHFSGTAGEQIASPAGTSDIAATPGHTMEGWVYIAGSTKGLFFGLEDRGLTGSTPGVGVGVGTGDMDTNGTTLLGLNENVIWFDTGYTLPTAQWVQVAFVYFPPPGVCVWYVNGVEVHGENNNTTLKAAANPVNFYVGGYLAAGTVSRVLTGNIATARHWQRPFGRHEIKRLYEEPYCFIQPPGPKFLSFGFSSPPAAPDLAVPQLRPIPQHAVHRM